MIYFLEAVGQGLVKIGTSINVASRLASLQATIPVETRVLRVMKGGVVEERELHALFKKHRRHGEWFDLAPIRERILRLPELDLAPLLTVCIQCGGPKRSARRDRGRRCRTCAQKRNGALRVVQRKALPCQSCGAPLGAKHHERPGTGLCRSCGMRKAWASDSYRASIMPARRVEGERKRKRCQQCAEPLAPNRDSKTRFHPSCWNELQRSRAKGAA